MKNTEQLVINDRTRDYKVPEIGSRVNYKSLRKLLMDRDLKRVDLKNASGLSSATIAKLGRDENTTTGALVRTGQTFDCEIADTVKISGSCKRNGEARNG